MGRGALGLVVVLTGCAPSLPVYLPAHSESFSNWWLVDYAAGSYLELPVDHRSSEHGSVKVDFVDTMGCVQGVSLDETGCVRIVRSGRREDVLAHELGHALGLEHVDDDTNLMNPSAGLGTTLDEEQLDTVAWNAGLVDACVPG